VTVRIVAFTLLHFLRFLTIQTGSPLDPTIVLTDRCAAVVWDG
jgi:hypothetical protein